MEHHLQEEVMAAADTVDHLAEAMAMVDPPAEDMVDLLVVGTVPQEASTLLINRPCLPVPTLSCGTGLLRLILIRADTSLQRNSSALLSMETGPPSTLTL
jgi:hypothetical protein